LDVTEAILDIYSNTSRGENVSFLIWDASEGKVYSNVTPTFTFNSDQLIGKPVDPILISCDNKLRIEYSLSRGWNWVSVNINNTSSNSTQSYFHNVGSAGDEIKSQESVFDKYSNTAGWTGTLTASGGIKPEEMYKIKLSKAGIQILNGTPFDAQDNPVDIVAGWNWIGFIPQNTMTVNEALASYGPQNEDLIKSQKAFSMYYDRIGWVGSLNIMEPGKGYMLKTKTKSSIIYPVNGLLKNDIEYSQQVIPDILKNNFEINVSNMTVVSQVADSSLILNNKVLLAFSDDKISGIGNKINLNGNISLFFINIQKPYTGNKLKFALMDTVSGSTEFFENELNYIDDYHTGTIESPFMLFNKDENEQTNDTKFSVYPIPFINDLIISGYAEINSDVQIRIMNVLGQDVIKFNKVNIDKSFMINLKTLTAVDLNSLPPSLYILEIIYGDSIQYFNIIKE